MGAVVRLDDYRPKPPTPALEEMRRFWRELDAEITSIMAEAEFARLADALGYSLVFEDGKPGGGGSRVIRVRRTRTRAAA